MMTQSQNRMEYLSKKFFFILKESWGIVMFTHYEEELGNKLHLWPRAMRITKNEKFYIAQYNRFSNLS